MKVMPHWHPDEWRTAVVLSGTLYFGVGEQWDENKVKAYPAGTFYSEPPRTPQARCLYAFRPPAPPPRSMMDTSARSQVM